MKLRDNISGFYWWPDPVFRTDPAFMRFMHRVRMNWEEFSYRLRKGKDK